MNNMPIAFPKTKTGSDIKVLMKIYTPDEVKVALFLSYKFKTLDEIYNNIKQSKSLDINKEELEKKLERMAGRNIFSKTSDSTRYYALPPFLTGLLEMHLKRLDPEFIELGYNFAKDGFGLEYLASDIPQFRVIPIEKSITPENRISNYNELKNLIMEAENISLAHCACKTSSDIMGNPCKATDRREFCLYFRFYGETFNREGWGREITKEEALEIVRFSEKEGLIIQSSNEKKPQFVCSCCSCCCASLGLLKVMPNPSDFINTYYYSQHDPTTCTLCKSCIDNCQMEAISLKKKKSKEYIKIDLKRCIGCGVCVSKCPSNSLRLLNKEKVYVPPETTEEMYEIIQNNKKNKIQKIWMILKSNPIKLVRNIRKLG